MGDAIDKVIQSLPWLFLVLVVFVITACVLGG